jgi:hypothetical protein
MKEQAYEYYGSSVKESLGVGASCVWLVGESLYKAMKPVVEYRIRDAIYQRNRVTGQNLRRRGMY